MFSNISLTPTFSNVQLETTQSCLGLKRVNIIDSLRNKDLYIVIKNEFLLY